MINDTTIKKRDEESLLPIYFFRSFNNAKMANASHIFEYYMMWITP